MIWGRFFIGKIGLPLGLRHWFPFAAGWGIYDLDGFSQASKANKQKNTHKTTKKGLNKFNFLLVIYIDLSIIEFNFFQGTSCAFVFFFLIFLPRKHVRKWSN